MIEILAVIAVIVLLISNKKIRDRLDDLEAWKATAEVATRDLGRAQARRKADQETLERDPVREKFDLDAVGSGVSPPPLPDRKETDETRTVWNGAHPDRPASDPILPKGGELATFVATWIQQNWFYALSALSLALAGLFAAQYAADRGIVTPTMRIVLASLFGTALIGGGEYIRRRFGDEGDNSTKYLPSVFSGAGIVTLFGAVLTARTLYDLIGPETALAGLVAVAALSIALGWFYGPLLTAIGIIGATAAPMIVGGEAGNAVLLHGYFGLVALAGLTVNALRKWSGITAISLALPFGAATLIMMAAGAPVVYMALTLVLACAGVIFLSGSLTPDMAGIGPATGRITGGSGDNRKTILAMTSVWIVAVIALLATANLYPQEMPFAGFGLLVLFAVPAFWSRGTDAVSDMPGLAIAGMFHLAFTSQPSRFSVREAAGPGTEAGVLEQISNSISSHALFFVGLALIVSLIAMVRSSRSDDWQQKGWALAAMAAPIMMIFIELISPVAVIDMELAGGQENMPKDTLGYTWALMAMGLALISTLAAERAARADGQDRFRVSLGALMAMSMIALGMFVTLSAAALSLALAVLVLAAVALDDRFNLPTMSPFVQAGTAVLVFRAVTYPDIALVFSAPFISFAFAYVPSILLLAAAWLLSTSAGRPLMRSVLEGGLLVITGLAITIWIIRLSDSMMNGIYQAHWLLGLAACVWLLATAASLRNAEVAHSEVSTPPDFIGPRQKNEGAGRLRHILPQAVRYLSAGVAMSMATLCIGVGLTVAHPVIGEIAGARVSGIVLFNTLIPAYLLPALIIGAAAIMLPGVHRLARLAGMAISGLLGLHWATLVVAHAWRGADMAAVPMGDGELWTYTAMLLAIGAVLMIGSLWRSSKTLRLVANGFLVLSIGKVFLVDAPDLEGLVRAASFLILGLCLAALAWVNRLATVRQGGDTPEDA